MKNRACRILHVTPGDYSIEAVYYNFGSSGRGNLQLSAEAGHLYTIQHEIGNSGIGFGSSPRIRFWVEESQIPINTDATVDDYLTALQTANYTELRTVAMQIARSDMRENRRITDCVEQILENYPSHCANRISSSYISNNRTNASDIEVDAIAWCCKILGQSEDLKYRTVLSEIIYSGADNKIKRAAKAALKRLK